MRDYKLNCSVCLIGRISYACDVAVTYIHPSATAVQCCSGKNIVLDKVNPLIATASQRSDQQDNASCHTTKATVEQLEGLTLP